MRKLIVLLLLAMLSGGAAADWVVVNLSDDGMVAYADPATIRKSGNMVRMWNLMDFKTAELMGDRGFLSQKSQQEYDCKNERIRLIYFTWHSGNMGKGNVVHTVNRTTDWHPVSPGSINEDLWRLACGKNGNTLV